MRTAVEARSELGGFDTVEIGAEARDPARESLPGPRDRGAVMVLSGPAAGTILHVGKDSLVVGRAPRAQLRVHHDGVSRLHARFFRADGTFFVEDLDSANGTWVCGQPVHGPTELRDGDRIVVGPVLLRFERQDALEEDASRRLYEAAVHDPLTRLHNRRYLEERLHGELSFALRHDSPLSLLMIDVDRFKDVNDRWGHPAGDAVLKVVAATVARLVRPEDVVARFGGEEICVLARAVDERNAAILAERIRRTIARTPIPWEGNPIRVTVSVGVAVADRRRLLGPMALVAAADGALYGAKRAGRDRVRCGGEGSD